MSEPPADTSADQPRTPVVAASAEDLAHHLHDVVLATPGVDTLVPTMTTALTRLRQGRPRGSNGDDERRSDPSADGVSVTVDEDAVTAVVDITVVAPASVLATALTVRSAIMAALESTHPGACTVRVNVLGLEPDPRLER